MYTYFDPQYHQSILALRVHHAKRVFLWRGIGPIIFLLFVIVISVMLSSEGALVFLSVPLSAFITYLYYLYSIHDVKKKVSIQNVVVTLNVKFNLHSMEVTSQLRNKSFNKITLNYSDILKGVETKDHIFLYKDNAAALALDKRRIASDGLLEFLKNKVTCR